MEKKTRLIFRWVFAIVLIIVGFILNAIFGYSVTAPFGSAGNYLIFVGAIVIAMNIVHSFFVKREKIIDERTNYIGYKTSKVVYLFLILGLFILMVFGMVTDIKVPLYLVSSYILSGIVLLYVITFKIIEKYN